MKTKNMTIPNWCGKFVSALAVLSVSMFGTSCNDEEFADSARKPLQLSVTANAPLVSRAIINDTYLPDDSQIGVTLTATDGSAYDNQDFYNLAYTASGTGAEQVWNSATPASLSTTSGKVIAYYPYNGSEELDLTAIPVETASQTDYMYAKPVTGIDFTSADINLNMQHAMTDIRINLKKGTYTGTGEVTKVTAKAAAFATSATMDAETGVFANVSGSGAQFVQEFTDLTLTTTVYSQDFLMVPDTKSTSGEVSILTIIDGKKFAVTVPYTESFQQGYSYVYNLTLDNSGLVLEGVDVSKWSVKVEEEQELEFYDNQYIVEIQVPNDGYKYTHNVARFKGVIDWGDGTKDTYTELNSGYAPTHTYATAGDYIVTAKGVVDFIDSKSIYYGGSKYPSKIITKLVRIGKEMGVRIMSNAFYNQTLLSEIVPGALDGCTKVEDFDYAFYYCNKMTTIPEGLFDKCTEVTSFKSTFDECHKLTAIPEGLFDNNTKVTSFYETFNRCFKLAAIPEGLFDSCTEVTDFTLTFSDTSINGIPEGLFDKCIKVKIFNGTFYKCTKVTKIPTGLFDYNTKVTDFGSTFADTNITEIPQGLFDKCPEVTTFCSYSGFSQTGCFNACKNLTAIPQGLFDYCTEVTNFGNNTEYSGVFGLCEKIAEIPDGIFDKNTKAETFNYIFYKTSITEIPEGLFDYNTKVTSFKGAFAYTKIIDIPQGLFDNNTKVSDFSYAFYVCESLATIPVGLFDYCTEVITFGETFSAGGKKNNITNIPAGLFDNNVKVTDFRSTFAYCANLTTIPEGLFDKCTEVTNFTGTFGGDIYNKMQLKVIPKGLFDNNTKVTSFEGTFRNTNVSEIPQGLFDKCTEVTSFRGTFYNTLISSIPTVLFDYNTKVTSFYETFCRCSMLKGESPYTIINVDGVETKVHLYERANYPAYFTAPTSYSVCYRDCTGLTDYSSIPSNWK